MLVLLKDLYLVKFIPKKLVFLFKKKFMGHWCRIAIAVIVITIITIIITIWLSQVKPP